MVIQKIIHIFAIKKYIMEKNASLLILYKYLKERKKLGTLEYYLRDFPERGNRPTENVRILNAYARQIDETKESAKRKLYFKLMLGNMSSGLRGLKQDYLYSLYKEWCNHININWPSMDKEYLNLKDKLTNGSNKGRKVL